MKREDLSELSKIGATMESFGIPSEGECKDYFFEVDENYVVTIIGKLKGEKPNIQAEVLTQGIVQEGGKVEIKVTASITEGTITSLEATNGAVLKTETSATEKVYEVSANGTYYFKTTADNGRSATVSIEVNTIIEKPIIEIKNIEKTSFTIAVTNNYKEGIITEYKYYVGGTLKSPANTTTKEFTVTGLTAETVYNNIYVEAYIGAQKLTSEVKTATTKPLGIEYSWEELAKVAKAISDDSSITRDTLEVTKVVDGKEYKLKVGDTKKLKVNGTEKITRIMGFNHDELTNSNAYGGTNTYAGISFEFVDFITKARMNSVETVANGWAATELRETLNNTTINSLENREQIKEVKKKYIKTVNDPNSVIISNDKLWLLACSEIWDGGGTRTLTSYGESIRDVKGYYGQGAITKEGERYKYYKDINACWSVDNMKLEKKLDDKVGAWWLRSPSDQYINAYCCVSTEGEARAFNPISINYYVAPGFAI